MMLERFYPKKQVDSAYEIPYKELYERGIRGVIFDVDNTLVPHGAPADERALQLFAEFHEMDMKTCLLSNNKEPRVASFAGQVDSPYIYKGGKPGVGGYEKAMEKMGTERETTVFVGDQLFTDRLAGALYGIPALVVTPRAPDTHRGILFKRRLEQPFLRRYYKKGGKLL